MQKLGMLAAVLAVSGWAQTAQIPSGTVVQVRLGQTISSESAKSGDTWTGTLARAIIVDGKTVAKRGASVRGRVVEAKASGRLSGRAVLDLQLTSVRGIRVHTETVSSEGGGHKGRNAKAIGGTAAAGAIIGAIAGGGKGAAIGAGAGAAAGTTGAAITGKKDVRFPVETLLEFEVR